MKRKGFTLIEIMLVVIIIGILTAMIVPNIAGRSEQARNVAASTDIDSNLSAALDLYKLDSGTYPTTEQGLEALTVLPTVSPVPAKWNGPYLKNKKQIKDPWGHDYVYVFPGTHNKNSYDLSSLGADNVESKDDVANWNVMSN